MTQFERLLQSRLGFEKSRGIDPHLDADQMSTFAESGMAARDVVIQHASHCAECREALFLLYGQRVAAAPAKRGTRTILRWAWIPAAATLCAVAIAVPAYLRRETLPQPVIVARTFPPPSSATPPAPAQPHPSPPVSNETKHFVPPVHLREINRSTPVSATIGEPPQVPPIARVQQPLPVQIILPARDAVTPAEKRTVQSFRALQANSPVLGFGPTPMRVMSSVAKLHPTQWVVTAGMLQESSDAGATWHNVAVDSSIHFLCISSLGNDVWAGGSRGALFHSSDNGENWNRIAVEDVYQQLRSDVVEIHVSTRRELHLQASDGQKWGTQDGGRNWIRE